jgi:hypothetical protein
MTGIKTDSDLTSTLSGAVVSYVKRDADMAWVVFQDGRVMSFGAASDGPIWVEVYSSVESATIDNYGTSQERVDAGFV